MDKALIFNIQRYSIHDGPGIRTLVFFKGCPLRCKWCANPEGIRPCREIQYIKQKCSGCGVCLACPHGAVSDSGADGFAVDHDACTACGWCVRHCPRKSKTWYGEEISLDALMEKLRRDMVFYRNSGGGVTLGGGDPLMQSEFAHALLKQCRAEGINTAIETEAYCGFERYRRCAALCDTVFTDLKAMDPRKHRALTGVDNVLILDNIRRLSQWLVDTGSKTDFILRIPLLPEINYDLEDMTRAGEYFSSLAGLRGVEILPFHNLGEHKYKQLGLSYEYEGRASLKPGDVQSYADVLLAFGLAVKVVDW